MNLTEEQISKIIEILDSEEFKTDLYEGLDEETRDRLGMFYTPGKICAQMIDKFDCDSLAGKNILDPTCGSGNLLIACLIAGADSDKLFGNEYDSTAVELCRKRLNRACDILGKPRVRNWQIHQGNALHEFALKEFRPDYDELYFDGVKTHAARRKKLEDESYDAYLKSKAFRRKHRQECESRAKDKGNEQLAKQAEQSGVCCLLNF